MEVGFYLGTTAERPTQAAKNQKEFTPRSSEARRESFCPLDKNLSWNSDYRATLRVIMLVNYF